MTISDQLRATSPARHADQVRCPVPAAARRRRHDGAHQAERIDGRRAKIGGQAVEFIRFAGEDHYMNLADTRIRVLKETEQFLKKNIGD